MAEHLEILGALSGGLGARIEGIGEARALDGLLGDAVDRGRCLDARDLEHGGRDVADMVELVTDLAALPDARRPVHDERIPHPSAVGVLLVALERGVAGHGPAQGVVVVQVGLADGIDVLQVLGQGVADAVEVAEGVHRAKGRALLAGAIVRDQGDQGVLQATLFAQPVHQPAHLQVGVLEHSRKGGLEPDGQPALVIAQGVPGLHPRIGLGQDGVGRHDAQGLLTGQTVGAGCIPALGEDGLIAVNERLWRVVRRVLGTQAHVEEEGLLRRDGALGADEADGLVDDVFREVIALAVGRIDVMVVEHQFGVPLAGLTLEEPIIAVEAALQRPLVEGASLRGLEGGRQVPLAGGEGVVAGGPQHLGQGACATGDAPPHPREAQVPVGQPAHAYRMVVAAGQQGRAGRRAQGGGVEVGEAQAAGGQGVDVRRGDLRAVAAQVGEAEVVEHDADHIGRAGRGLGRLGPVRPGLTCGQAEAVAVGRLAHGVSLRDGSVGMSSGRASAAQRKPMCPAVASGRLALRAATRKRKQ